MASDKVICSTSDEADGACTTCKSLEGVDFRAEINDLFKESAAVDAITQKRLLHIENLLIDIQFTLSKILIQTASKPPPPDNPAMA